MTVSGALAGIAALREARDAPSRACRWSLAGPNSVTPRFSVSLPVSKHGAAGSSTQGPEYADSGRVSPRRAVSCPRRGRGMGTSAGERMDRRWGGGSRRPPCAARGRMRRAMRSRGGRCGERRPARRLAARARRSACGSVGSGTQGGVGRVVGRHGRCCMYMADRHPVRGAGPFGGRQDCDRDALGDSRAGGGFAGTPQFGQTGGADLLCHPLDTCPEGAGVAGT